MSGIVGNHEIHTQNKAVSDVYGSLDEQYKEMTVKKKPPNVLDKADFLKVMVAQIRHQDPLSPQSSEQLGNQWAQFSVMDSNLAMGKAMEKMGEEFRTLMAAQASHLIDKGIEVPTDQIFKKQNVPLRGSVGLSEGMQEVRLKIFDPKGQSVHEKTYKIQADQQELNFEWDGKEPQWHQLDTRFQVLDASALQAWVDQQQGLGHQILLYQSRAEDELNGVSQYRVLLNDANGEMKNFAIEDPALLSDCRQLGRSVSSSEQTDSRYRLIDWATRQAGYGKKEGLYQVRAEGLSAEGEETYQLPIYLPSKVESIKLEKTGDFILNLSNGTQKKFSEIRTIKSGE